MPWRLLKSINCQCTFADVLRDQILTSPPILSWTEWVVHLILDTPCLGDNLSLSRKTEEDGLTLQYLVTPHLSLEHQSPIGIVENPVAPLGPPAQTDVVTSLTNCPSPSELADVLRLLGLRVVESAQPLPAPAPPLAGVDGVWPGHLRPKPVGQQGPADGAVVRVAVVQLWTDRSQ